MDAKICTQGLDTVYIVGRNGLIARSTDRSATWTKQYPVTAQLNDIIFCNHATGFAVGNDGVILKTTDAGDTWTRVNSGTTVNINAIAATGLDNIWAVGNNGLVLYSNDSGNIWQEKDLSISVKLNDVTYRVNTGFIVGNNGTIYKTIDKGINWIKEVINNTILYDFTCVAQSESRVCLLNSGVNNGGYPLFLNETFINTLSSPITSITLLNDKLGFGVSNVFGYTNEGWNEITIFKMDSENNWQNYFTINKLIGSSCSDIVVVNDTIGYVVTGIELFKISVNNQITALIENCPEENKIIVFQDSLDKTNLIIKSMTKKIALINVFDLNGELMLNQKMDGKSTELELNITKFSLGAYVIQFVFSDKSQYNYKWIKK